MAERSRVSSSTARVSASAAAPGFNRSSALHSRPAERAEQPDGGLFDKLVFGVGVGGHGSVPVPSVLGAARV
jgi:hypothetical protein